MDSTLNITPEGSQNEYNIPTTLRGDVDQSELSKPPGFPDREWQITNLLQLHWIEL